MRERISILSRTEVRYAPSVSGFILQVSVHRAAPVSATAFWRTSEISGYYSISIAAREDGDGGHVPSTLNAEIEGTKQEEEERAKALIRFISKSITRLNATIVSIDLFIR